MKLLIIGLGSIAQKHIQVLRELQPDVILYALRSSMDSTNHDHINNIFSVETINEIQPDFILISNPTVLHASTLLSLTSYNIPLFIEKPVLHNLDSAPILLNWIMNKPIKNYIACNLRFLDSLVYVKNEVLKSPSALNEVNVYAGSYLPDWRPNKNFRNTYSANASMGGGVHLDLIHELDYIYWMFGKPKQTNAVLRSVSSLSIDAVDYANYSCMYESFTVNVILNYYRKDSKRTLELVFNDRTIHVDLILNKISSSDGTILFQSNQTVFDTYKSQMRYFLEYIKSDTLYSMNDFNQGLDVLKIVLENDIKR